LTSPLPPRVLTSPLPPRPFTPAGMKGGFNSRSCFVAPNTVLHAGGCGARVMACVGTRGGRSQWLDGWSAYGCASWSANHPSASAAKRDTTQSACKVSAASEHAVSGSRSRPPAIVTVPSSAAVGGSGLALFERSEFSQTPPAASSAGDRAAARALARLSFAYFCVCVTLLCKVSKHSVRSTPVAMQRKLAERVSPKVSRPPGRDPASSERQNHQTKKCKSAAGPKPGLQRTPTNFQ
jgi:hypothetical protein